jgi:hypothetical protein
MFAGQDRLRIRLAEPDAETRVQRVREILGALQPDRPAEKAIRAEVGR